MVVFSFYFKKFWRMRIRLKKAKNAKNEVISEITSFLKELADFTLSFIRRLVFEEPFLKTAPYIVTIHYTITRLWDKPWAGPTGPGRVILAKHAFMKELADFTLSFIRRLVFE
jgi:hypothetical protein